MERYYLAVSLVIVFASVSLADTFGTGANRITIDFVSISGSTNPTAAQTVENGLHGFGIVEMDYRIGMHEITNDQWDKFKQNLLPTPLNGWPSIAYDAPSSRIDPGYPTDSVSWLEAAQFVNWLNTSKNHQPAYKFTGTPGAGDYTFQRWDTADAAQTATGRNYYRHKDAFYFLPTESEWFKAAYWNGDAIQDYATTDNGLPVHGNYMARTGWNYYDETDDETPYVMPADDNYGPWDVTSGTVEVNGTLNMMGNDWEWTESPYSDLAFDPQSMRSVRGGSWGDGLGNMHALSRMPGAPTTESYGIGFRVASVVPEPASLALLGLGGLTLLRRRRA
jgi:formylglycine-generating enzyme required for sulfatase activity